MKKTEEERKNLKIERVAMHKTTEREETSSYKDTNRVSCPGAKLFDTQNTVFEHTSYFSSRYAMGELVVFTPDSVSRILAFVNTVIFEPKGVRYNLLPLGSRVCVDGVYSQRICDLTSEEIKKTPLKMVIEARKLIANPCA